MAPLLQRTQILAYKTYASALSSFCSLPSRFLNNPQRNCHDSPELTREAHVAGLVGWTRSFLKPILGPRRCPGCGRAVDNALDRAGLCPGCAQALAPRPGGFCPRCGKRFGLESYQPETCGDCLADPPPWERLAFHGVYEGRLREIILAYKFVQGLGHARLLQDLLVGAALRAGLDDPGPGVVAPVPLHPRRLRWRGYNQSLELARPVAKALAAELAPPALTRIRNTTPQTRLDGRQRLSNLNGAFIADQARVAGRRILLVDDVSTTGSTLLECSRALLAAEAAAVDVLVLAMT